MSKLSEIIQSKDLLAFASYIENGGDLTRITDFERGAVAMLIRGRKHGRNWDICCQIAYLIGTGLPAYTDSGKLNSSPAVEGTTEDACTVIAETVGLKPEYVRKIWSQRNEDDIAGWREKGERVAEMYRTGEIQPW